MIPNSKQQRKIKTVIEYTDILNEMFDEFDNKYTTIN